MRVWSCETGEVRRGAGCRGMRVLLVWHCMHHASIAQAELPAAADCLSIGRIALERRQLTPHTLMACRHPETYQSRQIAVQQQGGGGRHSRHGAAGGRLPLRGAARRQGGRRPHQSVEHRHRRRAEPQRSQGGVPSPHSTHMSANMYMHLATECSRRPEIHANRRQFSSCRQRLSHRHRHSSDLNVEGMCPWFMRLLCVCRATFFRSSPSTACCSAAATTAASTCGSTTLLRASSTQRCACCDLSSCSTCERSHTIAALLSRCSKAALSLHGVSISRSL